jgi:hypothetical protein
VDNVNAQTQEQRIAELERENRIIRQSWRDQQYMLETTREDLDINIAGRLEAERQRDVLIAAWEESWDCSADPGHSIMSRAINDVRSIVQDDDDDLRRLRRCWNRSKQKKRVVLPPLEEPRG